MAGVTVTGVFVVGVIVAGVSMTRKPRLLMDFEGGKASCNTIVAE